MSELVSIFLRVLIYPLGIDLMGKDILSGEECHLVVVNLINMGYAPMPLLPSLLKLVVD
jgi:hypothetical protein